MNEVLMIVLLTLLPFLELRASIPYGILIAGMDWGPVFLIAVGTNILLGPLVYFLVDKGLHIFLRIKWIDKLYNKIVERTQRRIHKAVELWGELGVAIFIGIPLPGSGSYSGALGSYLIGLPFTKFVIANIIGNLIAGTLVTLASLGGGMFKSFIKI